MNIVGVKKFIYEAITIIIAVVIANLPLPRDLTRPGLTVLAILVWAVINWILNIMPDFAVMLFMSAGFVLFNITKFEVAFSAFAGNTFWLLLASLGLSAAVLKSGLLTRVSLYMMKILPVNFFGQSLAMFLTSLIIGPLIPSVVSKTTILAPMTISIAEKLGYEKKSKGMFGLWISMYYSFTHLAPLFISSSFLSYVILSFLPEETQTQFTYLKWLSSMLVVGLVLYVLGFIVINFLYKPAAKTTLTHKDIDEMLADLGKMSKHEKIVVAVMIACLIFWMLERILGVNAAITAILALSVLLFLNVLNGSDIITKINWTFLIFAGGAISLGSVFTEVGLGDWISEMITPLMSGLTSNKVSFLVSLALVTVVTRIIEVSVTATLVVLNVISLPLCIAAGINPWVGAVIILMFCKQYFFKYQSPETIAPYAAANGDETIGWSYVSKFNGVAIVLQLIALLITMPYWHLIGLM